MTAAAQYFTKLQPTASRHILVVEDDAEIGELVSQYLRGNSFDVSISQNGQTVERLLGQELVDLVILDLMLPDEDGLSLCRRLRTKFDVPIIMLTAMAGEMDRIAGLEVGADDYLSKPFNPRELLARIHAVLRRTSGASAGERHLRWFLFNGWKVNRLQREVQDADGTRIVLTEAEFGLLQVLCERAGQVLSREQLLKLTQGQSAASLARSVDVLISRLRRKIERDPHEPEIIKTVRSGGYLFAVTVETA